MTLYEPESHFSCLKPCNTHNSGNIVFNYNVLHINQKAHTVCDFNFIVRDEGLLKVTGSHVHIHSCDDLECS